MREYVQSKCSAGAHQSDGAARRLNQIDIVCAVKSHRRSTATVEATAVSPPGFNAPLTKGTRVVPLADEI